MAKDGGTRTPTHLTGEVMTRSRTSSFCQVGNPPRRAGLHLPAIAAAQVHEDQPAPRRTGRRQLHRADRAVQAWTVWRPTRGSGRQATAEPGSQPWCHTAPRRQQEIQQGDGRMPTTKVSQEERKGVSKSTGSRRQGPGTWQ